MYVCVDAERCVERVHTARKPRQHKGMTVKKPFAKGVSERPRRVETFCVRPHFSARHRECGDMRNETDYSLCVSSFFFCHTCPPSHLPPANENKSRKK